MLKYGYGSCTTDSSFFGLYDFFRANGSQTQKGRGQIAKIYCSDEKTLANCSDGDERAQTISCIEGASYDFEI